MKISVDSAFTLFFLYETFSTLNPDFIKSITIAPLDSPVVTIPVSIVPLYIPDVPL